jgi:hypothetical protein
MFFLFVCNGIVEWLKGTNNLFPTIGAGAVETARGKEGKKAKR